MEPQIGKKAVQRAPRVLISVLSYCSPDDAVNTLWCLRRQTYSEFDLQLIDNSSGKHCVDQIRQTFPDLEIRVLRENLGYTGGNNVALRQCLDETYDYVVICNHDIQVDEQAIERLVETAEANPDAGVVGGVETSWNGRIRAIDGGEYCPWISRARKYSSVETTNPKPPWLNVTSVQGALVLFTRRALQSGLLLDDNLFMFMDEIDIGFQLQWQGLSAYTDRRVLIRHKSEPYRLDDYVGYLSQRNRLYLVKKYGRWYHRLFYQFYALFIELPAKVVIRSLQGRPRFALACVLGHFDAMRGRMSRHRIKRLLAHVR